ncbi:MAG TPA: ATP-dependent sacrificial sulfur transferase LarE [Bacteroidales bacterium]|nr:ATP-dependent sacrificial sulfur transferase LarE [Bacteroidales bacterium]
MIETKSEKLNSILKELGSFVVAFSGGVDSSFLLYRAHTLLKRNVLAVTIRTPYIPAREVTEAVEFTSKYGIRHSIINLEIPDSIRKNPLKRCYLCKKTLFTQLIDFARRNDLRFVVDGSNADDTGDYRPGLKALEELSIRSPLLEAGMTKEEIRQLSKAAGLDTWDKPAYACLLTRVPYDTEIDQDTLRMVEAGESMLFEQGFPGTRVRVHDNMARIECIPGFIDKIIQRQTREHIVTEMKKIGFRYVSLDLEGYRTGSYNPEIKEK